MDGLPENLECLAEQPTGIDIQTADGVFIKQIVVAKARTVIPQHAHVWDHTSMLAKGAVFLWKDGVLDKQYRAPCGIFIKAGVKHLFMTLEDDTIIYCIHNLHGEEAVKILAEHQIAGDA